eukprot:jgi/Mesvir1/17130/Mv26405-RA.1
MAMALSLRRWSMSRSWAVMASEVRGGGGGGGEEGGGGGGDGGDEGELGSQRAAHGRHICSEGGARHVLLEAPPLEDTPHTLEHGQTYKHVNSNNDDGTKMPNQHFLCFSQVRVLRFMPTKLINTATTPELPYLRWAITNWNYGGQGTKEIMAYKACMQSTMSTMVGSAHCSLFT